MEKKEDIPKEVTETPEETSPTAEVTEVVLGEVPTEYGLVYRTPDGDMNQAQYLVWMGNLILNLKEAMVGNQ